MTLKKLLWPAFCGMMAMTVACTSDSTTSPGGGGEGEGGSTTPTESPVALSPSANMQVVADKYASWLNGHFVSMKDEAAYYTEWATDFPTIFGNYDPVGRVIWSAQANQASCKVMETTVSQMKFRGCTVSEGTGYGMLISYFQGDEQVFKSLWNYSRGFRDYFGVSLTPWITSSFRLKTVDNSSATDADLDIATSLILMYYKTGAQEYLDDALKIANAIWTSEIEQSSLLILSGNTSMWTVDPTFNLSYFSPVALRLFAKVDPNHNWNGVLDAMYTYMKNVQDAGTGVFPDWSDASGAAKNPPNGSAKNSYWQFDKESVRIPWRIAWDYYWFQDERAKAILDKLNSFIVAKSGGNPGNVAALSTSYSWNTSVGPDGEARNLIPSQWLAAWCATGISGNADWLNACTGAVNAAALANSSSSYFTDILLMMYSQLLNGAYVRPF